MKKDGRHDPDIFPNLLKNWCRLGINTTMQYFEYWEYRISGFEVIDKVLIWRQQITDGRHDLNSVLDILENWWINTCIQYVEHKVNRKSGFVDIRVTGYGREAAAMRRRTKP